MLQVPFRAFLEADADADAGEGAVEDWMSPGDVEARLMESLGWLLLAQGGEVVPSSATSFVPAELRSLLDDVLPQVAEANDLDVAELREEVASSWAAYLEFLGETDSWRGDVEDLADCLDVVAADAADEAGAYVLDGLAAAVAGLTLEEELAALAAVPAARVGTGDTAPDDTVPADATDEERRAAGRAALTRWIREQVAGEDHEARGALGGLSALASAVLGSPLTTGELRRTVAGAGQEESLPAALDLVGRLAAGGVLSATEPWTAPAGLGPAIAAAVRELFDDDPQPDDPQPDDPPA
ncbi:hypothetical protein GTR02_17250 [Kineococcus sp. R8]|nr:hypothetical protein [Kineococcus siccus]